MQDKGQINLKRGLNVVAIPWTQFNYNSTFEINDEVVDNIHWNIFPLYGYIIHW